MIAALRRPLARAWPAAPHRVATAQLVAVALALGAAAIAPSHADAAPLRSALAVEFALAVDSQGTAAQPTVRGRVLVQPGGKACARIREPLRQELRLGPEGALLVWPDRGTRVKIPAQPGAVPPAFEAVLVAISEPATTLPQGSALISRQAAGEAVQSRWRVALGADRALGTLTALEDAGGVRQLELHSDKGLLQKRFVLGPRAATGQRLPTSVVAEMYGRQGQLARRERWTLKQVPVLPSDLSPCAEPRPGQVLRDL